MTQRALERRVQDASNSAVGRKEDLEGGDIHMAKQKDFMMQVETWFMKLPALPKGGREAIVMITPWIALIFGVLGVLVGLAGLGILTFLSPFALLGGGMNTAAGSLASAVLALIGSALLLAAFPGTKQRKMQGWTMLFWSEVVSLIGAVVAISLSGVVFSLIAFYLLYQIKSYYK